MQLNRCGSAWRSGKATGTGSDNILVLGGIADSTFDLSSIAPAGHVGSGFNGFSQFQKTNTSVWTATGIIGTDGPWTVRVALYG